METGVRLTCWVMTGLVLMLGLLFPRPHLSHAAAVNLPDFSGQDDQLHLQAQLPDNMDLQDDVVKRGGFRPIPFPCNGYDNIPRCLNNGKGPRKTWTKQGRFCVCLCPPKWIGPECGYAANSLPGRRSSYPWGER